MGDKMCLDKNFDYKKCEKGIYLFWLENNFFHAEVDHKKKSFTIMMPPPNITGNLHMGHALDCTIQDIIARFKRMQGFNVLWLPGTDHASISTEVKLMKKLNANGIQKKDLTREKFLEHALNWKDEYQNNIINQIKRLGCSCDWERLSFTMDEKITRAVYHVFVNLYKKNYIYKGEKLINWCSKCKTVISDAEVEHKDCEGFLWHLKYKIKDSDEFLEFATTRPETLLGDTAIAVNPDDKRYKNLIGKFVTVPFVNREIKIISDDYVDMDYGTGVVKITPAHDFNDYEIGKRHNLKFINVFDDDGRLNENAGEFCGLDQKEARKKILDEMKKLGLFVKEEKISHAVGFHDRCKNIIEPMLKPQWFVKMEELVKPAIKVFKDKELKFWPDRFGKIYLQWLENLNDWCISRQLWWGHRIPAYYCKNCGHLMVSEEKINVCEKCKSENIFQDEDVLDTWFSSALWPFATLGWPEKTQDLDYFYPTDVLVTSYDIIFFWVIRMVFSGLEHTKKIPFKDVLIHGLIRDEQGRKMSKSLDNGIDPIEAINKYGADVLRMSLVLGSSPGNDLRFYWDKLESNRNFINKLWNASKFLIMNLEKIDLEYKNKSLDLDFEKLELEDKWILKKFNDLLKEVNYNLENYEHGIALDKIIDFVWNEFCDWYIEFCKIKFMNENKIYGFYVLRFVLINCLKLLHVFMPFVTEKLFLSLYGKEKSIMISSWPVYDKKFEFDLEEKNIEFVKVAIKNVRNARAQKNIHPSKKTKAYVIGENENLKKIFMMCEKDFLLCGIDKLIFDKKDFDCDNKNYLHVVIFDMFFYLPLDDLINLDFEIERIEKEKLRIKNEIERAEKKLSNEEFIKNAPKKIVDCEREKLADYKKIFAKIIEQEKNLKGGEKNGL